MKKTISLFLIGLLLIGLSACSGTNGSVMDYEGNVAITKGNKTISVSKSVRLKKKDAVSVGKPGSVWFRIDKYKTILLGELSEMKALSLKKNISLQLESGALLVRLDKAPGKAGSFEILAGSATVSLLDAGVFSIWFESADSAVLCVYQGSADICAQGADNPVTLGKGQQIRFDLATGTTKGDAEPIEFETLPKTLTDNLQDYIEKPKIAESSAPPPTSKTQASELPESAEEETPSSSQPGASGLEQNAGAASAAPPEDEPQTESAAPSVTFKYMWNGKAFKPYADISWVTDRADYIHWQLYDQKGTALAENGRFDRIGNGINLTNRILDVSPPNGGNLYPIGCTIRLTPYYVPSQGESSLPMTPIVMGLPYFRVATERNGVERIPVISTNIGFYFEHSYDSLADSVQDGRLRIKGNLMPLEGTKVPIEIDVLSD